MNDLPLIHPKRRSVNRLQPMKALRHFRNLVADKEDTEQVFHIIRALSGKGFVRRAGKFWASTHGQQILAKRVNLVQQLDNHADLRKLPVGSLGHAYCDFMEREGLTAQGLTDEYQRFADQTESFDDLLELYGNRLRDTHDLMHVLTGYGRDALGEACVLAFSHGSNPNLGIIFIAYAAAREIKRNAPKGIPIFAAVQEARRNGKLAGDLVRQDIMALLAMPIEDARAKLQIKPPLAYEQAHERLKSGGIDPYDLMGDAAAA